MPNDIDDDCDGLVDEGACDHMPVHPWCTDWDGDGLRNRWEAHGVDLDYDGTVDLPLAALGADPNLRDLFLEVDYLVDDANGNGVLTDPVDHSHAPIEAAIIDVVQSFANSGIQLHIDLGPLYGADIVNNVVGTGGEDSDYRQPGSSHVGRSRVFHSNGKPDVSERCCSTHR